MKSFIAFMLTLLTVAIGGQSFESVVNFDVDLSSLSDPNVSKDIVASQRLVILEGLIGDAIIVRTPDEIGVWASLLGGEWIGTEVVRAYACHILFRGESWIDAFSDKSLKNPLENRISRGNRLLVVCRIIGYDEEKGLPQAEMVNYRILN